MNLLFIEWLKIKRYRSFWILTGLFFTLLPLWNYEIYSGVLKMGGGNINILSQAYSFPEVWGNLGWWASIFIIFLAILVITLTCNEFSFRTHRQNIIDGWNRLAFFHAKVLLVLSLSVGTTLFMYLLGSIFGLSISGSVSGLFSNIAPLGYFFVLSLNYLGAALFIALLIRKGGMAISLFLFYTMIVEAALSPLINHFSNTKIGNLLPLQASDELLPFPLMKMAENLMGAKDGFSPMVYVLTSLLWISLYYFAGRRLMQQRDL